MNSADKPLFPFYLEKNNTQLYKPLYAKTWSFLPESWNLMKCFQYYHDQKELWYTEAIDFELKFIENKTNKKMLAQEQPLSSPADSQKATEEETKKEDINKETESSSILPANIKQQKDDNNESRDLKARTSQ